MAFLSISPDGEAWTEVGIIRGGTAEVADPGRERMSFDPEVIAGCTGTPLASLNLE